MAVELRYKRRFPNIFTLNRKQRAPAILVELKITATVCTSNGIPYALITWMMYGRQQMAPENSSSTFKAITRINGFIFRLCLSSLILTKNDGVGCEHGMRCLAHDEHAFTNWIWSWSCLNSSRTVAGLTQPRSHCNDRWASFGRSFDSSQFGDSGIFWKIKWFREKEEISYVFDLDGWSRSVQNIWQWWWWSEQCCRPMTLDATIKMIPTYKQRKFPNFVQLYWARAMFLAPNK